MKTIVLSILSFFSVFCLAYAQSGINYSHKYAAGGRLNMCVDSVAKNVYYSIMFPNQPNEYFNYLPEVNNVSIQINFRKIDTVENYRYSILVDDKPIVVNMSINESALKDEDRDEDGILRYTSLGVYPIKDKDITVLIYSIERPQDIQKSIFFGKSIPKASIDLFAKRFQTDQGVGYSYTKYPKEVTNFTFTGKDDELIIVKDKTAFDYLYYLSIKDKKTNSIVFESTSWLYGGYVNEERQLTPYVKINKSVFKKSGDYEISIQPLINWDNCLDCDFSAEKIDQYRSRYTLAITLDEENYTKVELWLFGFIITFLSGLVFLIILYLVKRANKKKMAEKELEQAIAKLKLSSIRSQLNPHFLFNALAGIQNLINKDEIDNANKYLSKFARLTRNVLDGKELISLSLEKKLLDDYLQMEELRFGFTYEIFFNEDLELDNIEIPSMLLQPFVENAVKHGLSQKMHKGQIWINFDKQENDLVLTITDNGAGFDTKMKSNGLGIQLSESRMELLNHIYKENRFILAIESTINGTKVTIRLTDWL